MLLHEVVEFAARAAPDGTALILGDERWSWSRLWGEIRDAAAALATRCAPGQRAMVVSDNRLELVALLSAAPMAGVPLLLGNTRLTADELGALAADVGPTALFGAPSELRRLESVVGQDVKVAVDLDGTGAGDLDWPALVAAGRDRTDPPPPGADDTAWIIHTSGTTGTPKGVELSHRSLLAAVANAGMRRRVDPDDVFLFTFPLFHIAAFNLVHLHVRRRPVVLLPRFSPEGFFEAVERHGVTSLTCAPTMISMLLDHPDRPAHDLSTIRRMSYGASAIPLEVLRRGMAELGCDFAQGYGMTELSGLVTFLDEAAHRRAATTDPHLLTSAGTVGPLASLRIVDPDGRDVPVGEPGEIVVRGDQVFRRYWDRPEATAAAFLPGGWFRTGDVGRLDDEGFLTIVDRLKDIIVTGGENVASLEVEHVLSTHPDVGAVAVIGAPDERWGEQVVAVVVPRAGRRVDEQAVLSWTRDRLAGFKRPRRVVVVDELPTSPAGKVLKRQLRTGLPAGGPPGPRGGREDP